MGGHTSSDSRTHSTSEIYDVESDTWGPTADLLEPRQESERPRLLKNGTVMLVGGHGSRCCDALTQADLFDPESGTWRPTGPMTHRRGEHAVVVLQSGDVLVVGGFDWGTETAPRPAEIYSMDTQTWTIADEFPEPGLVNMAIGLADGRVLVKGDGHSAHCYLFDLDTRTFTETGSLREERLRPTLTLLIRWTRACGRRTVGLRRHPYRGALRSLDGTMVDDGPNGPRADSPLGHAARRWPSTRCGRARQDGL